MFVSPARAQTEPPAAPGVHHDGAPATEALEAGVAHPEAAHGGGFPPFVPDFYASQLLWLAIVFGIFFYILNKHVVPQIGGVLENRRTRIAGDLDAAEKMRTDADAARGAYERDLAEARANSQTIAAEAREKAKTDADAERKRTEAELDAKLDAAQVRIGAIKTRALADVGQIAEEVTQTILADVAKVDVSREEAAGAVARARG